LRSSFSNEIGKISEYLRPWYAKFIMECLRSIRYVAFSFKGLSGINIAAIFPISLTSSFASRISGVSLSGFSLDLPNLV